MGPRLQGLSEDSSKARELPTQLPCWLLRWTLNSIQPLTPQTEHERRTARTTCGATDVCNMELDHQCFSRLARERGWPWGWGLKARTHRQRMP